MADYTYDQLVVIPNDDVLTDEVSEFVMRCIESIEDGHLLTVEDWGGNEVGCMDYILDAGNNIVYNEKMASYTYIDNELYHGKIDGYRASRIHYIRVAQLLVDLIYNNPHLEHDRYCNYDASVDDTDLESCLTKLVSTPRFLSTVRNFFGARNLDLTESCGVDEDTGRVITCFEMVFNKIESNDSMLNLLVHHANDEVLEQECSYNDGVAPCLYKIIDPDIPTNRPASRSSYLTILLEAMDINPSIRETLLNKPLYTLPDGTKSNWVDFMVEVNPQILDYIDSRYLFGRLIGNKKIDVVSAMCTMPGARESISCLDKILMDIEEAQEMEVDPNIPAQERHEFIQSMQTYRGLGDGVGNRITKTVCHNRDGSTVNCLDRLMALIGRAYSVDKIVLNTLLNNGGANKVMVDVGSALIKNSDVDIVTSQCHDEENRSMSCLQRYIDIFDKDVVFDLLTQYNGRSIPTSYEPIYNGYSALISSNDLTKPVCRVDGEFVSCISYLIDKYQSRFGGVDSFFKNQTNLRNFLTSSYIGRLKPITLRNGEVIDIRAKMYEHLPIDDFTESDMIFGAGNEYKYLKALESLHCQTDDAGQSLDGKSRRKCYDELCIRMSGAMSKSDKKWVADIVNSGEGLELRDDPIGICGVYDVVYTASNDEVKKQIYHQKLHHVFDRIRSLIAKNPRTTRRGMDAVVDLHLVTDSSYGSDDSDVVVVTYRDTVMNNEIDNKRVMISRIHKIPEVKRLFEQIPSLVDDLHKVVTQKPSKTAQTLKVVISNRPYDLLRASSCQPWSSCFNLRSGGHNDTIRTYIEYGAYIAYIVDDEWAPTWYARLYLVPANEDRTCLMIQKPYGLPEYQRILQDAVKVLLYDNGCNTGDCQYGYEVMSDIWSDDLRGMRVDYDAMHAAAQDLCINDQEVFETMRKQWRETTLKDYQKYHPKEYQQMYEEELDNIRNWKYESGQYDSINGVEITDDDKQMALQAVATILTDRFNVDQHVKLIREIHCRSKYYDYLDKLDENDFMVKLDEIRSGYDQWIDNRYVDKIEESEYDEIKRRWGDQFLHRAPVAL